MNIKDKLVCPYCSSLDVELLRRISTYVWEDSHHETMNDAGSNGYQDYIAYVCKCKTCTRKSKVKLYLAVDIKVAKMYKLAIGGTLE